MRMYLNIKSDLYKFSHTPLLLFHMIVPILGILLFLGYYTVSNRSEYEKVVIYIQALSVTFPILIGIILAMLVEMEKNAGMFQSALSTPTQKYIPHMSKLIVLSVLGFLSTSLATIGFGMGFSLIEGTTFDMIFYTKTSFLMFMSVLPIYLIGYCLCFLFGNGFGIGFGMVGGLVTALLRTGLGDGIWHCVPWGITSRFSVSLLKAKSQGVDFFDYDKTAQALIYILVFSVMLIALFILIFSKWQGRQSED